MTSRSHTCFVLIIVAALALLVIHPRQTSADSVFEEGIYVGQVGMASILFLQPMASLLDGQGNLISVDDDTMSALSSSFTVAVISYEQFSTISPPERFEEAHRLLLLAFKPVAESATQCRVVVAQSGSSATECLDVLLKGAQDLNAVQIALFAAA